MSRTLPLIVLTAALAASGCAGYRPDEVRFNDVLVVRASLLAQLAKEDAAADAALLGQTPEADAIRERLQRKADLADQVTALAAALYERTHLKMLSAEELAILIRRYKEDDSCPTTQPSR